MRNEVQLITYADRLAGDLPGLRGLLTTQLAHWFGGVHVLPFFTPIDGADAGFDPVDHTVVDPRLGGWQDLRDLAATHQVMADLIVNHVSAASPQFVDWQARGTDSPADGMFLTLSSVFPAGVSEADLTAIYRPRPGLCFTPYRAAGKLRLVWTTFTAQQIDIDLRHPAGWTYLEQVLTTLADGGVRLVRLDAVGYAIKTPGTSCFLTPETFAFIDRLTARAHELGLEVLVEVHSHYARQVAVAAAVDWVYDFALPPLVLYTLYTGDTAPLLRWLQVRPANAVTVLDTHDGIGVVDVARDQIDPTQPGLLTDEQVDALVEAIHAHTGGQSRQATGTAASNLDIYQVNATFYAALGSDDSAYLLARAIQFFTPGIPQVYYVGALAGGNDMELLERTGAGRDINRHYYSPAEVDQQLARPVVQALGALCRLRNTHPAFGGEFTCTADGPHLQLRWQAGTDEITLRADTATHAATLTWSTPDGPQQVTELLQLANC